MSKFQKYTNNTITVSADSVSQGFLNTRLFDPSSTNKLVFFGLQTDDGNFTGTLGHNSFSLDSNYSDCSATISDSASGEDTTTVRNIYFNIPKSNNTRMITFSYNGTPLFNILQQKKSTSVTYTYKVFIRNIGSNGVYPSIDSNYTLTDSPSSWSAIKITSSTQPLCTMKCVYPNSSDPYTNNIYMSDLCIAGENREIKYYDGTEDWNYGFYINIFYFSGQNCKLKGRYQFPFGKTNNDQYIDL